VSQPALEAPGQAACLVEVGGRTFAVEIAHAREAREFTELTVVPLAPPALLGMGNLRGAIVPVVDLGPVLSLSAATRRRVVRTLVVESDAVRLALVVDRVLGVESLWHDPGATTAAAPALERGRFVRGDDTVPILDVSRIVDLVGRWKR
jgi:purine-binding chemotaxis protein CheW